MSINILRGLRVFRLCIPFIIIFLLLIFFFATWKLFIPPKSDLGVESEPYSEEPNVSVFSPNNRFSNHPKEDIISLNEIVLGSPEIIKMLRILIFYAVPAVVVTIILYFIFLQYEKVTFSWGSYSLQIGEIIEHRTNYLVNEVQEKSKIQLDHVFSQLAHVSFQLEKVKNYSQDLVYHKKDLVDYIAFLIRYVRELFIHLNYIRYGFYFYTKSEELVGISNNGLSVECPQKLVFFLYDIIDLEEPIYCADLETRYTEIATYDNQMIHNVIGTPIINLSNSIIGVLVVYTKEKDVVFSQNDVYILNLIAQYFCLGLNQYLNKHFKNLCKEKIKDMFD